MNNIQQKAIEDLNIKNQKYIKKINKLISNIRKTYSKFDESENEFYELIDLMESASSKIPVLPYCNAYAMKDNKFVMATNSFLEDKPYTKINSDYKILTIEYMENMEKNLDKTTDKMKTVFKIYVKEIKELLDMIIASNSITKRLSGLQDKINLLENINESFWYDQKDSLDKYSNLNGVILPMFLMSPDMQTRLPFHKQLLIKNEFIFKTKHIHENKLNQINAILMYINEYLPFAELVPLINTPNAIINNHVSPKQVQLGSDNKFDGEINIGNEEDIK